MSFLQRPVEIGSAAAGIARFWDWWRTEIASLLPPYARDRLLGPRESLVVDYERTEVLLRHFAGNRCEVLYRASVSATDPEQGLPSDVGGTVVRLRRLGVPLILRLPRKDVLFRTVRLPKAGARELEKLLGYEIERQSPLARDAVLYDHRVGSQETALDRMDVTLRILRRDLVDAALAESRRIVGEPDAIGIADASAPREEDLFRFGRTPSPRVRVRRNLVPIILSIILILLAGNLGLAYERREATIEDMNARLTAIGRDVDRAVELQSEIRNAEKRATFGSDRKMRAPLVSILNDVATVLPDDSWIFEFSYKDESVRVRGFAPDASKLLRVIGNAPQFREAEFRAPVMPGRGRPLENFDIAFKAGGMEQ